MIKFELVVPAYNESANLQVLIANAVSAAKLQGMTSQDFQLVVVNNGSTDNSQLKLQEFQGTDLGPWFRIVSVSQNQGYGFGIWTGLQTTTADVVGWSHADLQCDPVNAFKGYDIIAKKPSDTLVKGQRFGRNWKDVLVSRVFETLAQIFLGFKIGEINAQPKVFPRKLLNKLENPPKTFAFDLYVLYQAQKQHFEIETIDVLFPPRIHGASRWAGTFIGRYRTILEMVAYILRLARTEGRL